MIFITLDVYIQNITYTILQKYTYNDGSICLSWTKYIAAICLEILYNFPITPKWILQPDGQTNNTRVLLQEQREDP